jgi:hypothetical protein
VIEHAANDVRAGGAQCGFVEGVAIHELPPCVTHYPQTSPAAGGRPAVPWRCAVIGEGERLAGRGLERFLAPAPGSLARLLIDHLGLAAAPPTMA